MSYTAVVTDDSEVRRLDVQRGLFRAYEHLAYAPLLAGRSGLRVLDLGCNNGSKTVERFPRGAVEFVLGLEFRPELTEEANRRFAGEGRAFLTCDVESQRFPAMLASEMARWGVEAFDIVSCSLILMHLRDPETLLRRVREVLAPGGVLVSMEANDTVTEICPDTEGLNRAFFRLLREDPLAGSRDMGARMPELLARCGYNRIHVVGDWIREERADIQRRQEIFDTYYSFLPQDVAFLREQFPGDTRYRDMEAWLDAHYGRIREQILSPETRLRMGVTLLTCSGGHGATAGCGGKDNGV